MGKFKESVKELIKELIDKNVHKVILDSAVTIADKRIREKNNKSREIEMSKINNTFENRK